MEVDLHSHSVHSDGTHTPEELLRMAQDKGLKVYALTDHDNIEGSKILMRLPHDAITLYSGIELNAKVDKGQMHILGYNIDLEDERLNRRLKELKEMARNNIKLYIKQLKDDFGIFLPEEDIQELLNHKGNIGRPMLALILIKYGYCKTVSEAFDKYLKDDKVRHIKQTITKEECLDLINHAGGIAVLAHPWSLKLSDSELHEMVAYLCEHGLKGIEVYHSLNSEERRVYYHELAQEFGLLETGGTDYHGKEVKPDIELGSGKNENVDIQVKDLSFLECVPSRYSL